VASGLAVPLGVSTATLFCFVVAMALAWWRFGQSAASPRDLAAVPAHCVRTVASVIRFFVSRQIDWVRTER
jgi:hypothetical protein